MQLGNDNTTYYVINPCNIVLRGGIYFALVIEYGGYPLNASTHHRMSPGLAERMGRVIERA